jgi:hypothetical protein
MKGRIAGGSMVLFNLLHKQNYSVNLFVQKIWLLPPTAGGMTCLVRDRVSCVV